MELGRTVYVPAILAGSVAFLLVMMSAMVLSGRDGFTKSSVLSRSSLTLDPGDRLLVLAPHPDDEVLGCGGVVQQALALGLPVRIVFLTYGDFYEQSFIKYEHRLVLTPRGVQGMGEIRHNEALAADATLGVPGGDLIFLGYPDFGMLRMWESAWGQAKPVRGLLSRATAVPYSDAFRPGAPYKGEEVLADLTAVLRSFRPTKVFVSHPADHHPDHRAFYLFARVALFDVEPEITPQVYPYLVHYVKWPQPYGRHPEAPLELPALGADHIPWQTVDLTDRQEDVKAEALKKHKTQYDTTPEFLDSFVRRNELFGDFPVVRLDRRVVPASDADADSSDPTVPVGAGEAHLVGEVTWRAEIEDEDLLFSVALARPLAREVGCSVRLFGYRHGTPFAEMPKLRIEIGELRHKTYEGGREIAFGGIEIRRSNRDIRIRVPLAILRQPQRILAAVRVQEGPVPLEWALWRVLEIGDTKVTED